MKRPLRRTLVLLFGCAAGLKRGEGRWGSDERSDLFVGEEQSSRQEHFSSSRSKNRT